MNYNDQQQNRHLLNWINQEIISRRELECLTSFEDQKVGDVIAMLLRGVDGHFDAVCQGVFDFKVCLKCVEEYLLEQCSLKMQPSFRKGLMESEDVCEIVKIVLFLFMQNSKTKENSVNLILELEQDSQIYLMHQLQIIQSKMQNNIPVKQIYKKIEELQEENQMLKEKIVEIDKKNEQVHRIMESSVVENQKLHEENREQVKQKMEVMDKLGLNQSKNYLAAFKEIQNQRVALIYSQKQIEAENNKIYEQNQEMEQKIEEDRTIISHLNQEINSYKQALQEFRNMDSRVLMSRSLNMSLSDCQSRPSFSKSTKQNKENIQYLSVPLFPNVNLTKSISHDTSTNSFKNIQLEDDDQSLSQSLRDHNENLQQKLQEMHGKISKLNMEIGDLKNKKYMLKKDSGKKEKIIKMALREFEEFKLNYEFTISG